MEKKQLIAFDFDGTLADTTALESISMTDTIHLFGHPEITYDNIIDHYGPTETGIIKSIVGEKDYPEAYQAYLKIYDQVQRKTLHGLVPQMKELLEDLKKISTIHVVEVTGRSQEALNMSLNYLGITSLFEKTYSGSMTGINKDVSMEKALADFHLSKKDAIYIGDTLEDIETMKKAGIDILSVSYCHDSAYRDKLRKSNPGRVYDDVKSLKEEIYSLIDYE